MSKKNKSGWIGVDLDGTLALHPDWQGFEPCRIGPPIPKMVDRVKMWLAMGLDVRIFTARASDNEPTVIKAIQDWCETHVGIRLPVTCSKDYQMIELWDDRAVQVIRNTGLAFDRDLHSPFGDTLLDKEKLAACKECLDTPFCSGFDDSCGTCPFKE